MARIAPGSSRTPLLAQPSRAGQSNAARTAAILAIAAVLCIVGIVFSAQVLAPTLLVERQADLGEDWFSAVEAPHKTYEWPWLKDGTFEHESRVMSYGPEEKWDYMTGWRAYRRSPFDEFGDRGYEVDQRPADDCYANGGQDCFREVFDPETGFLPA